LFAKRFKLYLMNNNRDKINLVDYLTCPVCSGFGTLDGQKCTKCCGRGMGAWFGDTLIFSDQSINRLTFRSHRIIEATKSIVDGVVLFLGFTGLVALLWQVRLGFIDSIFIDWFKITLLFDLYLLLRFIFSRQPRAILRGVRRKYSKNDLVSVGVSDWAQVDSLSGNRKVDVLKILDPDLKDFLYQSGEISKAHKQKAPNSLYLLMTLLSGEKIKPLLARLEINPQILKQSLVAVIKKSDNGDSLIYELEKSLLDASIHALKEGKDLVDELDMFLALTNNSQDISEMLNRLEISTEDVSGAIHWLGLKQNLGNKYKRFVQFKKIRLKEDKKTNTPILDSVSVDLTSLVKDSYFGNCFGREKEIDGIINVITGGTIYNVALVGESGSGRNKIVEGLAERLNQKGISDKLKDHRLVSLNITQLISKANMDTLFLQIAEEINSAGNVILVINDIKSLVDSVGEIFLKNPFIFIVVATFDDYARYVEKNRVLRETILPIKVNALGRREMINILAMKVDKMEKSQKVFVSYLALVKAVDIGGIRADQIIEGVIWGRGKSKTILASDISSDSGDSLKQHEELNKIGDRLVGQDEAVRSVVSKLGQLRVNQNSHRPMASFIFLGSDGAGKCELAKSIAKNYLKNGGNIIDLDMSEFQGRKSVERLVGSINYTGRLTEAISNNPTSLVFLRDIDMASDETLDLFSKIMRDGSFDGARGQGSDLTGCVIVATSSSGSQFMQSGTSDETRISQLKKDLLRNKLRVNFNDEFIDRFDEIVLFNSLDSGEIDQVTLSILSDVEEAMKKLGVELEIDDLVVNELVERGINTKNIRDLVSENIQDKLAELIVNNRISRGNKVLFKGLDSIEIQ
jgi:ATP-dependent Clp protease ATP-binding subunit ClpA